MSTLLGARPQTRFTPPGDLTAPEPPEFRGLRRDGVRLLVAEPEGVQHTTFAHLPHWLHAGDVVVVNTSATVAGQFDGVRDGRAIVVHLANRLSDGSYVVELRTAPEAARSILDGRSGMRIELDGGAEVELLVPYPEAGSSPTGQGNRLWRGRLHVAGEASAYRNRWGRPISYGYLNRRFDLSSYQTVFGVRPGSAEMPSAGRPFTPELITELVTRGVGVAPITLHTGVSSQEAGEGPQQEWYEVPEVTAELVTAAHRRGSRVVAVGTTATRAVESAAEPDGTVGARSGWTDLVITPDRPVRVVSGLITGWHDPEASHLLLVESVAGPELTQQAYTAAAEQRYLWHEFGDSCLLLPRIGVRAG